MENPSMISHVSIGTNKFEQALEFYDAVFKPLGVKRVLEVLEHGAVAYGKRYPEFWVQKPFDGKKAETANGSHFAFLAPSPEAVRQFYDIALAQGARSDGEPGPRPHYGEQYYGCFVRDLDGHKIEAMHWKD
ncbi:MAG: VOC family protein [Bdellovibrionales bacterium]